MVIRNWYGFAMSSKQIKLTLPFNNVTASVNNSLGRVIVKQSFLEKEGQQVTLSLPEVKDVLFMELTGDDGCSVAVKIPFQK